MLNDWKVNCPLCRGRATITICTQSDSMRLQAQGRCLCCGAVTNKILLPMDKLYPETEFLIKIQILQTKWEVKND